MEMLSHIHSGIRWIILLLLLGTIFKAFAGLNGKRAFTAGDKKMALFTLIFCHTQLVIGLVQYFAGKYYALPSSDDPIMNSYNRFFKMEHISMMLLALALITVGYSTAKRASSDAKKFKKIAVFYTIGLVLILAAIPWPFMAKFANLGWF